MSRYREIRRSEQRQELDRITWPDIYELMQEITLHGRGMYLMEEPLYFGVAYEEPPFMTYSVTAENPVTYPEVITAAHPSEEVLDAGNHRGETINPLHDGSFEVFGQNGGLNTAILPWGLRTTYTELHDYLPGGEYGVTQWVWWVQQGSGATWTCVDDKAFHGNHSARIVLDDTSSRILSPVFGGLWFDWSEATWDTFYSWEGLGPPYVLDPHHNPPNWHNRVYVHVFAEAACQLRVEVRIGGEAEFTGGKSVDTDYGIDGLPIVTYQEIFEVAPGSWQEFMIEYPTPYRELYCVRVGEEAGG